MYTTLNRRCVSETKGEGIGISFPVVSETVRGRLWVVIHLFLQLSC